MSFQKAIAGYRLVPVNRGDTLQRIAARELGDPARWYDLAGLNGLVPPYIVDDAASAGPGVLVAGGNIKLPSAAPSASGVSDTDGVFGTDVALFGGQISDDGAGGMATVSGTPNLVAALQRRLVCHRGDLLFHPEYGCRVHELVGRGGTETTNALAGAYLSRALQADTRVARIETAEASIAGDTVTATAVVVAIDGRLLPAVSLPTAAN